MTEEKDLHGYAFDYRNALRHEDVEAAWHALSNFVFGEMLRERSIGFDHGLQAGQSGIIGYTEPQ